MVRSSSPKRLLRSAAITLTPVLLALALPASAADPTPAASTPAPAAPAPTTPATASAPAAPKDPVLATVNGSPIKASDVLATLGDKPPQMEYPQLIDQVVILKLLTQAGRADKLADDPEVKDAYAHAVDGIIARTYVSRLAKAAVTDQATKAEFDAEVASGQIGEEFEARHILVKTEAEAKAIIAQLDKGADFGKLAAEKSTDKSAKNGELGYFTKDRMVPEFSDAVAKLKKGEYTKVPVKTKFGWHVIQLEDRRPVTLDQVKGRLQEELGRKAFTDKVAALRATAQIQEFNPDGTPLVKDAPPPAPAPTPASQATPPAPAPNPTKN